MFELLAFSVLFSSHVFWQQQNFKIIYCFEGAIQAAVFIHVLNCIAQNCITEHGCAMKPFAV
jgi:hypothetical protein